MARRWLPVVGGVLAVILAIALAWWGWDTWQTSQANKASVAYDRGMEALQANNPAGAASAFAEAAKTGNGAYKALALSQQSGLALQRNNKDEALRLMDEAAKASRDPLLSDVFALKSAFLIMEGALDAAKFADVQKRLEPLTKEGRPMRAFAQEALALAQLQMGQIQPARTTFVQLQLGQDVPDQVRQRAQAAIDTIDTGIAPALAQIVTAMDAIPPSATLTPEQRGQAPAAAAPAAAAPAAAPAPAQ